MVLPPLVVYRHGLPKTNYSSVGPADALYRSNESGYVNSDLYLEYMQHLEKFIPSEYMHNCIPREM